VRWKEHLRHVELALGLGIGVSLGWMLLSALALLSLMRLGLSPGIGLRWLALGIQGLVLVGCLGAAGLVAGILVVANRGRFAGTCTLVAVTFRCAIFVVTENPNPPWRDWPDALTLAISIVLGVVVCAWMFGVGNRLVARRNPAVSQNP
jgi:hypothetical protein